MAAKKVNRQRARQEKRRQATRRKKTFWIFGGLAALFVGLYFAFAGAGIKAPITEGLSDEQVDALRTAPEVGARAPDFTISDVEGTSSSLSDYLGKPIALMFFHSWWQPCNQSAPEFRRAELEFGDELTILFVDQEEPLQPVLDYAKRYELTSTFLMDPSGAIGSIYRLRSTPTTYFLDQRGVIQDILVGPVNFNWLRTNVERSLQ